MKTIEVWKPIDIESESYKRVEALWSKINIEKIQATIKMNLLTKKLKRNTKGSIIN